MFDDATNLALAVGLTVPRIVAAFLMLPLLTPDNMPAMVRNSFFVSLALVAMPIAAGASPLELSGSVLWAPILLKEILLGLVIGFAFGIVFWALGIAGELIDAKVGSNIAQIVDPVQGHQTTLIGAFFSQFAAWLFMASGAFLIFIDLLLTSYVVWPIMSYWPQIGAEGQAWLFSQFGFLMTTALLFAAPAIVVMMLLDLVLGLLNRFSEQLNVFSLSLPIKAWVAIWVIALMLGVFVELIIARLFENRGILEGLRSVF